MDEKRKFSRVGTPRLRVWCEGPDVTLYVPASNLSEGGMFVRTASQIPPAQEVRVVFRQDPDEPVVARAEVAWVRRKEDGGAPGLGLRFVNIEHGEQALGRLLQKIRRRRSQSDPGLP